MTLCRTGKRRTVRRWLGQAAALTTAAVLLGGFADAMPVMPQDAPIPRLLANVGAYVKQHPRDPNGYYALGRIHYFAFAAPNRQTMPVIQRDTKNLPIAPGFGNPGRIPDATRKNDGKTQVKPAERKSHVKAALRNLQQAIRLEARQPPSENRTRPGLAELTLACVYEEGKSDASLSWQEEAIRYYRIAYKKASVVESKQKHTPIFGIQTLVSHEAAMSYLRLVRQRGARTDEKQTVAVLEQAVQHFEKLPPSLAVTPIVFSLDVARPLSSLVAPRPEGVAFDLDGSGRAKQLYGAWPHAETGILVWDPTHSGHITSGRQLFGSATWWLFWDNGYRALQSLDDNQDGWLTDGELAPLGVWNDRNSNGKCEAGEVRPLSQTDIAGLNVRDAQPDGTHWVCEKGIRLQNGTYLPTYDWTVNTMTGK